MQSGRLSDGARNSVFGTANHMKSWR